MYLVHVVTAPLLSLSSAVFFWQCGPIWRLDLAGRLARSPTDGGKTAAGMTEFREWPC